MKDEVKAWLEYAERDLKAARGLAKLRLCANACIDAQQAAEKPIKGYILAGGQNIPRTHNLIDLAELTSEPTLLSMVDDLRALSKYYLPLRYPDSLNGLGDEAKLSKVEVSKAIKTAAACLRAVKEVLA
jgi:HEPN domain-containing protein